MVYSGLKTPSSVEGVVSEGAFDCVREINASTQKMVRGTRAMRERGIKKEEVGVGGLVRMSPL